MPEVDPINTVAIVGAGTMGANIALDLASHGLAVRLTDIDAAQLGRGLATIRDGAETLSRHGLLGASVPAVMERIAGVLELDDALAGAGLVIEAVPENLQRKWRVFMDLERRTGPQVILASNTSAFVPSSLAIGLVQEATAERLVVMHYWNPAHLMPLVEVVPHARTLPAVLERVSLLLDRCAKQTVILRKEIPGFIGNRLAFALQREAMRMVEDGVASPEDIDTVARSSFGRRMPATGIFRTADLGGLDVYRSVCELIFPTLCNDPTVPENLKRLVDGGMFGVKTGEGWHKYTSREADEWREQLAKQLLGQAQADQAERARRASPASRSDTTGPSS